MDDWFKTIEEHWAYFLERDIPAGAPDVQVMAMKKAFASGAISGLQLTILATKTGGSIIQHVRAIENLGMATNPAEA